MEQSNETTTRPAKLTAIAVVVPRTRAYLLLLLLLLPLDYFSPTAALMREAGARPAIPLMLLGSLWIFWRHWPELFFRSPKLWRTILLLFIATIVISTLAFVANVGLDISYWDGLRSPWGQFLSQGMLYALVAPVLIAHAWLFSRSEVVPVFFKYLPRVVVFHLAMIAAEAFGLLRADRWPLWPFRGFHLLDGRKPTGLMTEPSYVGAFAAMYGLALLLCMPKKRWWDKILGVLSILVALQVGGKTLIPALLVGLLAYGYQTRIKVFNWKVLAAAGCVGLISIYTVLSYSVLDVRANLSSAMRLGSTLLALNAAASGYGLLGLGFGQFHFVYSPVFAPNFLVYLPEADYFFGHFAATRASTYNLPARFLVEEGLLGLLLFGVLVYVLFRHGRKRNDLWHQCGAIMAGSSLGFLLTQDTYFFPAFVCGAAILASRPTRRSGAI